MEKQTQNNNALVVGVSACLLGEAVRYDGSHKAHGFVTKVLRRLCTLEAVCPEVAVGLGVPRPPVHLVNKGGIIHAVGRDDDSLDITDDLTAFSASKVPAMHHFSGYVLKSRSPSCGLSVEVTPRGRAPGLYAAAILDAYPLLPCIEDDQLNSTLVQSNFLERMVAYRRWQDFTAFAPGFDDLAVFHDDNALSLISHGREGYNAMARLISRSDCAGDMVSCLAAYGRHYMAHMARPASLPQHVEALRDAATRLPRDISKAKMAEINRKIAEFSDGNVDVQVPLKVLNDLLEGNPGTALARPTYLHPHPLEAGFQVILRNAG